MHEPPYTVPASTADLSLPPSGDQPAMRELAHVILTEMQQDMEARIDWRLQQQPAHRKQMTDLEVGVALGSLGIAIPLSAIAVAGAGFPGLLLCWVCIVLVNIAWATRR